MSQNFRSLAHIVWEFRSFEDIFTKDELLNYPVRNEGNCRSVPAKLGLLKVGVAAVWHIFTSKTIEIGGRAHIETSRLIIEYKFTVIQFPVVS